MTSIQLICLLYNCDEIIYQTLESWISEVDRFMLFIDNKSDIKTIKEIKRFKKNNQQQQVLINFIDFDGFSNTRNECFKRSYSLDYTWTIVIDDSYKLLSKCPGALKKELEKHTLNENINCLSVFIKNKERMYKSKRIVRTYKKLRYEGNIHENIAWNENSVINDVVLSDIKTDKAFNRSLDRVYYDLQCLDGKTDPRSLYYRACMYIQLLYKGEIGYKPVIEKFMDRINTPEETYPEECFTCWIHIGNLYHWAITENILDYEIGVKNAVNAYLHAAMEFPSRQGECYFFIWLLTNKDFYLVKAHRHRFVGKFDLTIDMSIYSNNKNYSAIDKCWIQYLYAKNFPSIENLRID